jgi:uncharacterized membrane protein YraQ (UPF0718 family)
MLKRVNGAAGASLGVAGVLLITLPALSVPSIVMAVCRFVARQGSDGSRSQRVV